MFRRTATVVGLALALVLAVVSGASAATDTVSPKQSKARPSIVASRTYDLDFTLPTQGKSGCTVCHADRNLVRVQEGVAISLYVDVARLGRSAHSNVPCTGCHVDFAYKTPHDNVVKGQDWRSVAKLSCKNCHSTEFSDFASGAHSPAGKPGQTTTQTVNIRRAEGKPLTTPLCGDCHGGHDIPSKEDTAAQAAYHKQGLKICGGCHKREAAHYVDYYHGAAYRRGAPDAPACWDCHGTHEILPASDRNSKVSQARLVDTCGKCHADVDENYTAYAQLIHRKSQALRANPLWEVIDSVRKAVTGAIETIESWFRSVAA